MLVIPARSLDPLILLVAVAPQASNVRSQRQLPVVARLYEVRANAGLRTHSCRQDVTRHRNGCERPSKPGLSGRSGVRLWLRRREPDRLQTSAPHGAEPEHHASSESAVKGPRGRDLLTRAQLLWTETTADGKQITADAHIH